MPAHEEKSQDYTSLRSRSKKEDDGAEKGRGYASVSAFKRAENEVIPAETAREDIGAEIAPRKSASPAAKELTVSGDRFEAEAFEKLKPAADLVKALNPDERSDSTQRKAKERKAQEKDQKLLKSDNWLVRNGHSVTYAGIFLFTLFLYFRPYELFPILSPLSSAAYFISMATLLIYLPSQLANEGNLTARPAEVNYILLMVVFAVITIPIGRDAGNAWNTFNDVFIKVVITFIMMVNVVRTELRLKALMWLSIGVGLMLSVSALQLYREGKFTVEDYRVGVDFGGMFGNPNELAQHFILFIPMAVALGFGAKKFIFKAIYWVTALLMVAGTVVTFSRGGFLGLIAATVLMAWKLGRKNRLQVMLIVGIIGLIFIAVAPGNYGLRILSIFIPGLDPVGSSNQRSELLKQSFWVTMRNPWGIGMGNFSIGSSHNLVTHNAYTQVSSELGIGGLIVYVLLITSPFRRLGAVERELFASEEFNWIYYLAIGIQASIIAYMVGSFFGSFAYNWFVYYPVAYAIALRRIYLTGKELEEKRVSAENAETKTANALNLQTA